MLQSCLSLWQCCFNIIALTLLLVWTGLRVPAILHAIMACFTESFHKSPPRGTCIGYLSNESSQSALPCKPCALSVMRAQTELVALVTRLCTSWLKDSLWTVIWFVLDMLSLGKRMQVGLLQGKCTIISHVTVAESAPQADTQSVCIICTTVDNISTYTEHRSCLSAIVSVFYIMAIVMIQTNNN